MKYLLYCFTLLLFLSACRTPSELVDKALKKDPSILNKYTKKYDTLIKIDTFIRYKDTLYIPQKQVIFKYRVDTTKVDSVQTLYEDSKAKAEYWRNKYGQDILRITCKGDTVFVDKEIPVKVYVNVPGKQGPDVIIIKKNFFYWLGLIVGIIVLLFIIYIVYRSYKITRGK